MCPTKIVGLHNYYIKSGDNVDVEATLQVYQNQLSTWMSMPYRELNFYLYNSDGKLEWQDSKYTGFFTDYGMARETINTKSLSLSPGKYILTVKYGGNCFSGMNHYEAENAIHIH